MKKIILFSIIALSLISMSGYASATSDLSDKKVNFLRLYEKNPTDWSIVKGGAWGKMIINGSRFVFLGHKLQPKTDYTLIRYTDPWPGSPVCLASKTSNGGGNVTIGGAMENGGPKVWLVKSEDVDCDNKMTGWNPTEYLFENNLIQIIDERTAK